MMKVREVIDSARNHREYNHKMKEQLQPLIPPIPQLEGNDSI